MKQGMITYCVKCRKKTENLDSKIFRIEKVIKRKGNKSYLKWKGYDNSFNSWIDKKDIELNSLVKK